MLCLCFFARATYATVVSSSPVVMSCSVYDNTSPSCSQARSPSGTILIESKSKSPLVLICAYKKTDWCSSYGISPMVLVWYVCTTSESAVRRDESYRSMIIAERKKYDEAELDKEDLEIRYTGKRCGGPREGGGRGVITTSE